MVTLDPSLSSIGEVNFKAARDINIFAQADGVFLEPDLAQYRPYRFPQPRDLLTFINIIERQHILMLSGDGGVDKADLARHVAWYLSDKLGQAAHNGQKPPLAREWDRKTDIQKLFVEIQKTSEVTIFLLPKVTPQDIYSQDIFRLQEMAKRHYIVLSTDVPFDRWMLPPTMKNAFWTELTKDTVFRFEDLAEMLIVRLLEVRDTLPAGIVFKGIAPTAPICGRITPLAITRRLKTFDKVRAFVSFLRAHTALVGEQDMLDLINRSAQLDSIRLYFREWYRTTLDARGRLFALNLSFFNGLYEDQFFAALEHLVEQLWSRRDPSLRAFDYDDLIELDLFFGLTPTRSGGRVIEARSLDQRHLLLAEAWNNHRRQILAALPHLVDFVKKSVKQNAENQELLGTRARRVKMREVISDTLGDIGLLAADAIQPALIELAIDNNIGVQLVAARALAGWRYYDKDQQLFDVLKEWQTGTYAVELMRLIQQNREAKDDDRPEAYIRATIALTVGEAASYDPPNKLAQELLDVFIRLSKDQNRLVRERFVSHTLPQLVSLHLAQVQPSLRIMTRYIDLDWPIAASLAGAYRFSPRVVMRTLAQWHNECNSIQPAQRPNPKRILLRETLMATIALTYGEIDYDTAGGPLTADEGFKRLQIILREERHPFVRTAVVIAITSQARRNFPHIAPYLQACLADVAPHEREDVVKILVASYAQQRAEQSGGHESVSIKDNRYPVWFPIHARPFTAVESILLDWIKDERYEVAQQIAIRAFVEFERELDRPIRERIAQVQRERSRTPQQEDTPQENESVLTPSIQTGINWYVYRLVPWLVSFNALQYRQIIRGLLPEILRRQKDDSEATHVVLNRFIASRDTVISEVGRRLQRAIALVEHGCIVQASIGVFALLGIIVVLRFIVGVLSMIIGR